MARDTGRTLRSIGSMLVQTLHYDRRDGMRVELRLDRRGRSTELVRVISFPRPPNGKIPAEVEMLAQVSSHKNVVQVLRMHKGLSVERQFTVVCSYLNGASVDEFFTHAERIGEWIPEPLVWRILKEASLGLAHCAEKNWPRTGPGWYFYFEGGIKDEAHLQVRLSDFSPYADLEESRDIGAFLFDIFHKLKQPPGDGYSPLLRQYMTELSDLTRAPVPIHTICLRLIPEAQKVLDRSFRQLPAWAVDYFIKSNEDARSQVRDALKIEDEFRSFHDTPAEIREQVEETVSLQVRHRTGSVLSFDEVEDGEHVEEEIVDPNRMDVDDWEDSDVELVGVQEDSSRPRRGPRLLPKVHFLSF